MRYDLAAMLRRSRNPRRSQIILRPIVPTATMAGDLYAAAYKPIILAWQRGIEAIGARYETVLPIHDSIHAPARTIYANDSIFDLDSILASIEGELQRLVLAITPGLRDWAIRAEGWQRGKWRGAVLTATGIDTGTLLAPSDVSETVEAFLSRNVGLIRSVSDEARARFSDIVLRNYQARTPARQVAKEMVEAVGLSRKRALRISADQNSKMAARLDQARQEQAGITSFKWHHSLKKHPRAPHVAHDGKVYRWDDLPLLDGKPDRPGDAPFCGCRAQAVLNFSE
jgi:SPP1 gp7 family putative phage head morphogenesis protein